jgi:hypothetical protein
LQGKIRSVGIANIVGEFLREEEFLVGSRHRWPESRRGQIKGKQSLDGGPDWLLCRARAAAYATWICPAPFSPGNAAVSCFSPCISFPLIQIRNKKKLHHRAMHREQRQLWCGESPYSFFGSWPASLHNCHFVDNVGFSFSSIHTQHSRNDM